MFKEEKWFQDNFVKPIEEEQYQARLDKVLSKFNNENIFKYVRHKEKFSEWHNNKNLIDFNGELRNYKFLFQIDYYEETNEFVETIMFIDNNKLKRKKGD